jgi:hypothetical protein
MTTPDPISKFYEDAMYMHFIHLGYSEERARVTVARLVRAKQQHEL